MKQSLKSGDGERHEPAKSGLFRVAIVGAASLKGKELKDVLSERNFPADVRLLDDDESLGQLENVGEEPTFIQNVLPEHLERVDFTFFAADEDYTKKTWQMAKGAGSEIIDVSYGLENEPGVQLRAPWIERELKSTATPTLASAPVAVAHPAATMLALLMLRAQNASRMASAIATVLEPASERGRRGMDELHEQTVNLLSFQQMPTAVYDTQIAFNAVSRFGEHSGASLSGVQDRILRHFAKITGGKVNVPSVMLLQIPVFHGYGVSLYIEFEKPVSIEEVELALEGEHITIAHTPEDSPSNVNAAGQEMIQVAVRQDPQRERGMWIWAVADNLKISAMSAVEAAETMAGARPRGTVQ